MGTALRLGVAGAAAWALGAVGLAGDTPEVEPNEFKANATSVTPPMIPGDTLSGASTGSGSASGGASSRDFFRVAVGATVPAIYRNRLTITTSDAHAGAIMGLPQSGAASDTTTVQISSGKVSQWYSFGAEHQLHYRVTGSSSTAAPYSVLFEQSVVNAVDLGSFQAGLFTITTVGQGHTTDTEVFLYDAAFHLIRWNDDRPTPASLQSSITQALTDGRHYIAIGTYNLAPDVANESGATDASFLGERMDFPGAIARNSAASNINVAFAITDEVGPRQFPATLTGAFEVYFATFTVGATPCPADITGDGSVTSADLGLLLGAWGGGGPADITRDGEVNAADLAQLLGAWGPCP